MAVYFITSEAQSLLNTFDARILQNEEKGEITTWEKSEDGKYYTHKAKEWRRKAWFKPKIESKHLQFNIIKLQKQNVTTIV
jgi:hypothetical protein